MDAIAQAQKRLLELRKERKVVPLRELKQVSDFLPVISQTEATSGANLPETETCRYHREPLPCPVCAEQRQTEDDRARRLKTKRVAEILGCIGIGARYRLCSFDNYQPSCDAAQKVLNRCRQYAVTFSDRLKSGDNVLMLGNMGNGKNHLAAAICNAIAEQGFQPLHTSAIKVVRRIRATWKGKEDEQEVIDSFSLPDLLVMDEVGRQVGSDDEKRLLFDVLNGRYEEQKPTIIISNLKAVEVQEYLGEAIMDRLKQGKPMVLEFTWESWRSLK